MSAIGEIEIALGGSYAKLIGSPGDRVQVGGGQRGPIYGFSPGSRRRLFDCVNKLDREGIKGIVFVTLTYPGEYSRDWRDWKRDLMSFWKRLDRAYGHLDVAALWRLEFQQRGAPHFHLLLINIERIDKDWISQAWYEVVGSGDHRHLLAGTRVEGIRDWRVVFRYIAKYMVKEQWDVRPTGRIWGVLGRGRLVIRLAVVVLGPCRWYAVRRVLRNYLEKQLGHKVLYGRGRGSGLKVYISSGAVVRLLVAI
jgi:hypothetical protein